MWAKLDDALLDHRKILGAGRMLGPDGRAVALGFYCAGLLYSAKHLTDGYLAKAVVEEMHIVKRPLHVAGIMVEHSLWELADGGYLIHDFHRYNPQSDQARGHRAHLSAVRSAAGKNGAAARWQKG